MGASMRLPAASGTGGTFCGSVRVPQVSSSARFRTVLVDPPGSSLFEYVRNGALKSTGSGSITEGIGIARITANLEGRGRLTMRFTLRMRTRFDLFYRLLREEGLFLGSTSGINVAAAVRVALETGPPGTPLSPFLCDGGAKYQSRLFNREWLEQKRACTPMRAIPHPARRFPSIKALVA